MLANRCSQPGRLSSIAAVSPAAPPPRITTRGSSPERRASGIGGLPQDLAEIDEEVEVEPEGHSRGARTRDTELAADRLAVEIGDLDLVVTRQHAARAELLDPHVDQHERL